MLSAVWERVVEVDHRTDAPDKWADGPADFRLIDFGLFRRYKIAQTSGSSGRFGFLF